jgi:hypothetical protein
MKKIVALGFLVLTIRTSAQISIGADGISLAAGTTLYAEGLTLTPQGNFNVTNTTLQKSTTPVNIGGSVYSIANVVNFSAPISFSGTIRLNYLEAELNGNAESQLLMAYQSSSVWATSSASVVNITDNYVEETVSSKTFDAVTASVVYSSLPVSLLSFTAKRQSAASILLRWATASEQQNSHFAIERSGDGVHYETIGGVPASVGVNGAFTYSFVDNAPLNGINYYRLKQYDLDGNEHLYGVRIVHPGNAAAFLTLYPNPVVNNVKLELATTPAKPLNYTVQNASGQVVQTGTIYLREQWLETSRLMTGFYVLRLENGQALRFFKK